MEKSDYGEESYPKNRYLYNGKELNSDKMTSESLNWYDYGWREFDPQIGRFTTQDRFAEKYLDLSPYQYGANNPINNIDVNGDSIWFTYQYNKDKELTGVTMHVSGKVINVSDNDIDMDAATADITEQLQSSFQGEFDGVTFTTEAYLSVAKSMDDVGKSDHVFALAEMSNGGIEGATVIGASNRFGGKVAFIDADYFTGPWDKNVGNTGERTAGHEFGHLANQRHGGNYFNIMRQGAGNSFFSMSTDVTSKQLKSIYNSYRYGLLNQGSNLEYLPVYNYTQGRWTYKKMPNRGIASPFIKY